MCGGLSNRVAQTQSWQRNGSERTGRSRGTYLRLGVEASLLLMEKRHWEQELMHRKSDGIDEEFVRVTNELMDSALATVPMTESPIASLPACRDEWAS